MTYLSYDLSGNLAVDSYAIYEINVNEIVSTHASYSAALEALDSLAADIQQEFAIRKI